MPTRLQQGRNVACRFLVLTSAMSGIAMNNSSSWAAASASDAAAVVGVKPRRKRWVVDETTTTATSRYADVAARWVPAVNADGDCEPIENYLLYGRISDECRNGGAVYEWFDIPPTEDTTAATTTAATTPAAATTVAATTAATTTAATTTAATTTAATTTAATAAATTAAATAAATGPPKTTPAPRSLTNVDDMPFNELLNVLHDCWGTDTDRDYLISVLDECHNYKQRNFLPDPARDFALMFAKFCLGSYSPRGKVRWTEKVLSELKLDRISSWPAMTRCVESFCFQDFTIDTLAECTGLGRSGKWSRNPRNGPREELAPKRFVNGNYSYSELLWGLWECRLNEDGKNVFLATLDDCHAREVAENFAPAIRDFSGMVLNYCRMSEILTDAERQTKVFTYENKTLAARPDWRAMQGCLVNACREATTPLALTECATEHTSDAWWSSESPQRPSTLPPQYGENDLTRITMGVENATYSALLTGLRSCLENKQPQLIRSIDDWYAVERSTSRQNAVHRFALLLNKYCSRTKRSKQLLLPASSELEYENHLLANEPNWDAIEECLPRVSRRPDFSRFASCVSPRISQEYWLRHPERYHPAATSLNSSNWVNLTAAKQRGMPNARSGRLPWWGVLTVTGAVACLLGLLQLNGRRRRQHSKKQLENETLPLHNQEILISPLHKLQMPQWELFPVCSSQ